MSALRDLLPALRNKTYFNYGGQGPLPQPSLEAITRAFVTLQELGPFADPVWPYAAQLSQALRHRLSQWLEVDIPRLALSENVTAGCVLPLWGLPWQRGDQLLIGDAEHPGVVAACRELAQRQRLTWDSVAVADLRGPADDVAALVLERLEAALTPRTRLVVLSHLLWNTGQLLPIAAIAARLADHPVRPWLLVDAAQSLGSLPLAGAAAAADIYACTGHKWCCGPEGLGVVALSERLLAAGRPTLIGWRSLADESTGGSNFHRDARRFEVATSCLPLAAGLDRSLQLLEAEGEATTRLARIRERSLQLWEGLQRLPGAQPLLQSPPPAGLVSFTLADRQGRELPPKAVVQALGEQGIWLRTLPQPACIRACTHLVSTEAEVERLLEALKALVS
ncbi:MAG: aminotransferase class V-fold PLP-dependent enzyme [Synechococcaceae cyanobacterium]|nr:aminotransferase class V-fold PLP-dependent enzyme [Synechococcaceae cyanobacterium]